MPGMFLDESMDQALFFGQQECTVTTANAFAIGQITIVQFCGLLAGGF